MLWMTRFAVNASEWNWNVSVELGMHGLPNLPAARARSGPSDEECLARIETAGFGPGACFLAVRREDPLLLCEVVGKPFAEHTRVHWRGHDARQVYPIRFRFRVVEVVPSGAAWLPASGWDRREIEDVFFERCSVYRLRRPHIWFARESENSGELFENAL